VPAPEPAAERRALLGSIAVTTVLGVLGVAWGIASRSQMILLDGVYAVIGVGLSWLLLRASALAVQGPSRHYPYGREAATPLVIGVQGFVLLGTLVYAAVEAGYTIRSGGSDVTPGWAMLYGLITAVASLGVWRWLRGAVPHSDLIAAEATAWKVAALRGAGMVVGFGIMLMLLDSRWDGAAAYIDPAMVLVTCVAFVPAPLRMVRHTIVELLEGAPPDRVQSPVREILEGVRSDFDLGELEVRMTKVGVKLYVEVDGFVDPNVTVAQEDAVRSAIRERLGTLPYDVWLNVELRPSTATP
jgi:predicted Co/Zn/Cd cation transporter (cation efflux family)